MDCRYLLLVSVIGLFLLSASVQAQEYGSCSDTDGGKDYATQGTTIGTYAGTGPLQDTFKDYCTTIDIPDPVGNNLESHPNYGYAEACEGSSCYVHEYYCEGPSATQTHRVYSTREPCQYGCKEGSCLPAPTTSSGGGSGSSNETTSSGGGGGSSNVTCPTSTKPTCAAGEIVAVKYDSNNCESYYCTMQSGCEHLNEKDKPQCEGGKVYTITNTAGCQYYKCEYPPTVACPDLSKQEMSCKEGGGT